MSQCRVLTPPPPPPPPPLVSMSGEFQVSRPSGAPEKFTVIFDHSEFNL